MPKARLHRAGSRRATDVKAWHTVLCANPGYACVARVAWNGHPGFWIYEKASRTIIVHTHPAPK
jgi:hypothetical protein